MIACTTDIPPLYTEINLGVCQVSTEPKYPNSNRTLPELIGKGTRGNREYRRALLRVGKKRPKHTGFCK